MRDATTSGGTTHRLPADAVHYRWSRDYAPAIEVEPGDTVVFETPEITKGQLSPTATDANIASLDFDPIHQISGPVGVKGAEPGDTLMVEFLEIAPADWGWTAV